MTISTAFGPLLFIICAGMTLAQEGAPLFACNLKAISAAERPRYSQLVKRVREAVRERTEIENGYRFKIAAEAITLPELAEWMGMERLCCPFLTLQLTVTGSQADCSLTRTGPNGAKPLIDAEFPSH